MSDDMLQQLERDRDRNLGRILLKLERKFTATVLRALEARGVTGLKMAHIPVLGHIRADGSRAVEIAQAAGISKQAAGKMIDALERDGLVQILPDPADSRARIIRFTERGQFLLKAALEETGRVERAWAEMLGLTDLEALKTQLTALLMREEGEA